MKKALFLVCFMLFSTTVSYAQSKYLTDDEKEVTEKDLDNAFVAPSSKFVGKKWYSSKYEYMVFNANGTCKQVGIYSDDDYSEHIDVTRTTSGRWKRDKQYLNITILAKTDTYTPNPSDLKKFSLRKQDEIKRDWANVQKKNREKADAHQVWEILKLNNDYIILNVKGEGRIYFYSQKMLDELHKRAAEKE